MEGYKTIKKTGKYLCREKALGGEKGQFSLAYFNLHTKATNNYTFITVNTVLKMELDDYLALNSKFWRKRL
jgi:hypothetical protein